MGKFSPVKEYPSRDVSLTIPAQAGYLVLARLALSAVCRLTPLEAVEVADLKLAVTEAANEFVSESELTDATIDFDFRLANERLVLELSGARTPDTESELELSRAIIEATVDDSEFTSDRTLLVKRLQ
ncbi:MAG: ATP-binding protein [Actinomycetota bacterium]|nr:ATP-binding protein [Actinomycetota bacterium]